MTRNFPYSLLLALGLVFFAFGCVDDDDPEIENPEEVITRVRLTLIPGNVTNDIVTYSFVDTDGDGGNDPIITSAGDLVANAVYSGSITFDNEDESITEEIEEEDEEHQIFYVVSNGLNLTVNYSDSDGDGNPVGLLTQFLTGDASAGNLTVILRHEPDKSAMALPGNPAAAGGETDIEISFPVTIP